MTASSQLPTDAGVVEAIWLRPAARTPVRAVREVRGLTEVGLDGDHAGGGKRQITILSGEAWDAACAGLGRELDPRLRRANVLVRGVALPMQRGAVLKLGALRVQIEGETRPCELLDDEGGVGLCAALRSKVRAGIYGRILCDGLLRVGSAVSWLPPAAQS